MQKLLIRRANTDDIDLIYHMTQTIVELLPEKEFFAADDKEYMLQLIEQKGFTLIADYNNEAAGFINVKFPMEEEENLGYDIALSEEELCKVVHIETIVVLPKFRGKGLQVKLMMEAEKLLQTMDFTYYMATVYPKNNYSLNNFLSLDYEVVMTKLKYGGMERHILMKTRNGKGYNQSNHAHNINHL